MNTTKIDSLTGWIIISGVLLAAAQFQSTEQLAALFAYLILIGVIMANHTGVFSGLTNLIGSTGQPGGGASAISSNNPPTSNNPPKSNPTA